MGELLQAIDRQGLGRPPKEKGCDPSTFSPPTLSDLGYTKDQSHRWQTIADLPEEDFEREIAEKKEQQEEITTASVYRLARQKENEKARNCRVIRQLENCRTESVEMNLRAGRRLLSCHANYGSHLKRHSKH